MYQSNLYGIETMLTRAILIPLYVSIEPLWNWNYAYPGNLNTVVCINRTFMELKLLFAFFWASASWYQSNLYGIETTVGNLATAANIVVSIEPLWNWNFRSISPQCSFSRSINRTFMELKRRNRNDWRTGRASYQSNLYGIETFKRLSIFSQ